MADPLTQEQLNEMAQTPCPECGEFHDEAIYLHGRCHPSAKVEAGYLKKDGTLEVRCGVCKKLVAKILVAEHP